MDSRDKAGLERSSILKEGEDLEEAKEDRKAYGMSGQKELCLPNVKEEEEEEGGEKQCVEVIWEGDVEDEDEDVELKIDPDIKEDDQVDIDELGQAMDVDHGNGSPVTFGKGSSGDSEVLACPLCPFVHIEEEKLQQHIEKVHPEEYSGVLGNVGNEAEDPLSPSSSHQHPTTTETVLTPTQPNTSTLEVYTCSECGKVFKSKLFLTAHERIHTGKQTYLCSQCGKGFKSKSQVTVHERSHTGERPYVCCLCEKTFVSKSSLTVHTNIHKGQDSYCCSQCGKNFWPSSSLRKRPKIEPGKQVLRCAECEKTSSQPSDETALQQSQNAGSSYQCPKCEKSFLSATEWLYHQKSHSVGHPLSCPQCGKKAPEQTPDGENVNPCTQCGANLTQISSATEVAKHQEIDLVQAGRLKVCSHHDKFLEIFCRTDQECICHLCVAGKHQGHVTVLASAERPLKQKQLVATHCKFQRRIQEKEKGQEDLRQAVQSIKRSAQAAVEESERICVELIRSIEKRCSEVTELIRAQEKAQISRAEGLLERLEQEMILLRRRDGELEQLLRSEDDIHFLKNCLAFWVPFGDSPLVAVSQDSPFEAVRESVSKLKNRTEDFWKGEMAKISQEAKTVSILQPTTTDVIPLKTAKATSKRSKCAVVGCKDQHKALFSLPMTEDTKLKLWLSFIFNNNVPPEINSRLLVCARHFTSDCFLNEGQYNAGFAKKLSLKEGSIPSVREKTANVQSSGVPVILEPTVCASQQPRRFDLVRVAACQTDPVPTKAVGTQLSLKTLQPHFRSSGTQTMVKCREIAVQTDRPPSPPVVISDDEEEVVEEEEEEPEEVPEISEKDDPTYSPGVSDTESEASEASEKEFCPIQNIPKYIVYDSCLQELFKSCPVCSSPCAVRLRTVGTMVEVSQECPHCEFSKEWKSQPLISGTPAGNLHLSAAIYFAGVSFFKVEKVFSALNLQTFAYASFRRHARTYLEPAILHKWKTEQDAAMQRLSEDQSVVIGGDMRADNAGWSTKFGSYVMMDLKSDTIVDIQLVKSNEVEESFHMEKEGLKRSLALFNERGVTPECVLTDLHPQIQEFLREMKVPQNCDVWHLEKGLARRLEKIARSKGGGLLKPWMRSIRDHLYWSATSSTSGPERVAKWTSILNHVRDIHTHDNPLFAECVHPARTPYECSKWLTAGTPAFKKLERVVTNERMLKDVENLGPYLQAPLLQAFHGILAQFVPRDTAFPFLGMLCRLYLAAFHFNENKVLPQATSTCGEKRFRANFPKGRDGVCRMKAVKAEPTFNYVAALTDLVFDRVFPDPAPFLDEISKIHIPEDPQQESTDSPQGETTDYIPTADEESNDSLDNQEL